MPRARQIISGIQFRWHRQTIGVAHWATKIVEKLPAELKDSLPTVEEIEEELTEKPQRQRAGKAGM